MFKVRPTLLCVCALTLLTCAVFLVSCTQKTEPKPVEKAEPYRIAVFVPGMVQGSPSYEMLVAGVQKASAIAGKTNRVVIAKVIEGGFNQGDWQNSLLAIAAENYDLIVSSNPSIPELAAAVALTSPTSKFLILDGTLAGNPAIKTIAFDEYQQAYLNGYFAALVSISGLKGANKSLVLGLLAGQEYPIMDNQIKTGFLDGAQLVDPGFSLDFRVLGNWFDAAKASELTRSMIANKVDVILTIAGGANPGVVAAAKDAGCYVTWFDSSGYSISPGTVVGSTTVNETDACSDAVLKAIAGTLDYGTPTLLGIADGVVGFDLENPALTASVPAGIIGKEKALIDDIKSGKKVVHLKS